MSVQGLPTPDDKDLLRIVQAIQQLARGRSNASGTVTLAAGVGTTVVPATHCSQESQVFLSPRTANAAAAQATTYVSFVGNKTFTITHAVATTTDRTFGFVALG